MASINDSVSYVTDDDDLIITTLIGGVLLLLGFLIIPAFVYIGYLYKVMKTEIAQTGDGTMPEMTDWGDLIIDGLRVTGLFVVYAVITALIVGVLFAIESQTLLYVAIPLIFLISFIYPMIVLRMAAKDKITAGFDIKKILEYSFTKEYIIVVIMVFFFTIALNVVSSILFIIPILGWLAGAALVFAGAVVFFHMYAQAYNEIDEYKGGQDTHSEDTDSGFEADWD